MQAARRVIRYLKMAAQVVSELWVYTAGRPPVGGIFKIFFWLVM